MYPSKKNHRLRTPSLILALVVILVLAAGVYCAVAKHSGHWPFSPKSTTLPRPVNSIDYSPATKQDNQINEERKSAPPSNSKPSSSTTTPNQEQKINVQITNANANGTTRNLHVGTYVAGTTSGTCTLTASMNGEPSVTKTSTVQPDASTYSCGAFNISYDEFPASGNWTISLEIRANSQTASDTWNTQVAITK